MDDNDTLHMSRNSHDSAHAGTRKPYVRRQRPRRSAEAIDNLDEDDSYASSNYCHDSNISVGGSAPFSGRVYSKSRANIDRMQRTSQYARYLEIPKGKRQIFASQERARQVRSRAWLVAILAVLFLTLVLVLSLAAQG